MTMHDIYTVLAACDKARARALRVKREAEERLTALEALRLAMTTQARAMEADHANVYR